LPSLGKRIRRAAIAGGAVVGLVAGLFAGLGPAPGNASSHREAPLTSADPQIDGTDLYAFISPDKPSTVTIVSNWIPFEEPAGGPNFYKFEDGVYYDVNIDNDGDAKPDIIYRWVFKTHYRPSQIPGTGGNSFLYNEGPVTKLKSPALLIYQTYDLFRIDSNGSNKVLQKKIVVPSRVGDASMPDFPKLINAGINKIDYNGGYSWVGQADDPFFLDLRVFDLLYGGNFGEIGDDTLAGFNIHGIVLQVPNTDLALKGNTQRNPVIGVWTTAERQSVRTQDSNGGVSFSGPFVQVSRLGMPLVNEVVVPTQLKDHFNASLPKNDAQYLPAIEDPILPHVVNAVYGLPVPDCPGDGQDRDCDLVPVFLTGLPGLNDFGLNQDLHAPPVPYEALRMNMTTPLCTNACSPLGVIGGDNQGFPNGRRLSDDIIDVSLRVTEGILIPGHDPAVDTLGDGVGQNDRGFRTTFPYLGEAWSGSDPTPHFVS